MTKQTILDEICTVKRQHVALQKERAPLNMLMEKINNAPMPRGFIQAIKDKNKKNQAGFICEIKKASPSQGIIDPDFNPIEQAKSYVSNGATCISILTDTPYFKGTDEDFLTVRNAVSIPLLRKDFIIDPYQIYETRAMGADCLLLIVSALTDEDLKAFYTIARSLGLDVLIEVHDEAELNRALAIQPEMIGINNRNLKNMTVDLESSHILLPKISNNLVKISESGIKNKQHIDALIASGANGFLIGESLMRDKTLLNSLTSE